MDLVVAHIDSARPAGVHRAAAEVRSVCGEQVLSEQQRMSLPPVDRVQLVATRRDLHQHPELGFEETRTATLAAGRLKTLGYEVKTGVGKTGVVAVRSGGGGGGRCVLLRADMDALPVEEANEVPYRSKHPGKMH